jgi:hypothetical protein
MMQQSSNMTTSLASGLRQSKANNTDFEGEWDYISEDEKEPTMPFQSQSSTNLGGSSQ